MPHRAAQRHRAARYANTRFLVTRSPLFSTILSTERGRPLLIVYSGRFSSVRITYRRIFTRRKKESREISEISRIRNLNECLARQRRNSALT